MAATAHPHLSPMPPSALPEIPAKRYFAIGEVAELCGLRPHVLRYWEQEFPQLKPAKRRGNRRYYLREDIEVVCTIRRLLHEQGFTITGARQQLAQRPVVTPARRAGPERGRPVALVPASAPPPVGSLATTPGERQREIQRLVDDLEGFLGRLDID